MPGKWNRAGSANVAGRRRRRKRPPSAGPFEGGENAEAGSGYRDAVIIIHGSSAREIVPASKVSRSHWRLSGLAGSRKTGTQYRRPFLIEEDHAMSPLVTALLCFGVFVVFGLIAKVAIGMWMKRQ
jgi:hypothetical protein